MDYKAVFSGVILHKGDRVFYRISTFPEIYKDVACHARIYRSNMIARFCYRLPGVFERSGTIAVAA
jgi:hypothetical protein